VEAVPLVPRLEAERRQQEAAWGDYARCGKTGKARRLGAPKVDD
jgi:hypothetical protein